MIKKNKILKILQNAFVQGWTVDKLTLSLCIGAFIAISPFPGFHTLLVFVARWLFKINFSITLIFSIIINNPWTMIPIYSTDYFFGYWLLHKIWDWHPNFTISLEKIFLTGEVCIFSFIIGGMILSVLVSLIVYPIAKFLLNNIFEKYKNIEMNK